MRNGKGLAIGKLPVCRLGLSGRLPTRQDKNQWSSQQPRMQNTLNRVIPSRPCVLSNQARPTPFHSHREDANTDKSPPEERNIPSNPNQNPAFGSNQHIPLMSAYPRLPTPPLITNKYTRFY